MSINLQIRQECVRRGISRLCHFTPSRNLAHIIAGQVGILATKKLEESERNIFNPTDLDRFDGHKDHICCSIEYPNVWYFSKSQAKECLFRDWVVLLIKPDYLWRPKTLFCQRNAAAGHGRYIQQGYEGFISLFEEGVFGAGDREYRRGGKHLLSCPTDNQAEVLIQDNIDLSDLAGVIVRDDDQAKNELCRLKLQSLEINCNIFVSPTHFNKYNMRDAICSGVLPEERLFVEGEIYGQN